MLLAAFLLYIATTRAADFSSGGLYFNILSRTDKTVAVTYKDANAKANSIYLTDSLTIPSSVTHNGTIYSVTAISNRAFFQCFQLTSETIPASVTSIGSSVFTECIRLRKFYVASSNNYYASLDGILLDKTMTTIITYPNAKDSTSPEFPSSVTAIGESAFEGCNKLTDVKIPRSVTSIGDWAFEKCSKLKKIKNYNPIPQKIGLNGCNKSNNNGCKLYVPRQSVELYKKAKGWNDFLHILAL